MLNLASLYMEIDCYKDAENIIKRCHPMARRDKDSEIIEKYNNMIQM